MGRSRLLWTVLFVGVFSCKPSEVQFDGDVFIVMKGGNSIKLGLVEVRLVPEGPMKAYIAKRVPEASAQVVAGIPELRTLAKTWHESEPAWRDAMKVSSATPYDENGVYDAVRAKERAASEVFFGAGKLAFAAAKKLEELGKPTAEFFSTGRPAAVFWRRRMRTAALR